MTIRQAEKGDIDGIIKLLRQVANVHHELRPDLFAAGVQKYTRGELEKMLAAQPIFVAVNGAVLGYAICEIKRGNHAETAHKTLYIDDLCVDENQRGKRIGSALYAHVVQYARDEGCYNITLNVWTNNERAEKFYASRGLKPQKTVLEQIIKKADE